MIRETKLCRLCSWIVFAIALTLYWVTCPPGASFWDCPEYVAVASGLEVGHPPGNPFWALTMRVAVMFFPAHLHALVINLSSGVFMAFASLFLFRIIFFCCSLTGSKSGDSTGHHSEYTSLIGALGGSLVFALCGSVWFSAIEAEVYAMSTFLSALTLWLMTRWWRLWMSGRYRSAKRNIYLVIYLTGLSLGVHQLGLLCIPVYILIYSYGRYPSLRPFKRLIIFIGSLAAVGCILAGFMGGVVDWAAFYELLMVNSYGGAYNSGCFIYVAILILSFALAVGAVNSGNNLFAIFFATFFFWQSGLFIFGANLIVGLILSVLFSAFITIVAKDRLRIFRFLLIGLALLLTGYSPIIMLLIRGIQSTPLNEGTPSDIFALSSYLNREQYGSVPLIYGRTPNSRALLKEEFVEGQSVPSYRRYIIEKERPNYKPYIENPFVINRSRLMDNNDINRNEIVRERGKGYLVADYRFKQIQTPELNMWFPRITSSQPFHISAYRDWAGMSAETMDMIEISETLDSLGHPAGRLGPDGNRTREKVGRPTYLQHLRYFLNYQLGYMYFRYLGWNFIGRQNDRPSTGEIDHGNILTGIKPFDALMLGNRNAVPPRLDKDNPGRNVFYGIPFLIGLAGIAFLLTGGRKNRRLLLIILLLFLMTGPAIVVYLNQTPAEPRERDYSFLGSYMAYAIFIGIGLWGLTGIIGRLCRRKIFGYVIGGALSAGLGVWFGIVNFDDNDRRNRNEPYELASDVLSIEKPSVIFSYGDNFSFPLWYVQEVIGEGSRHTIVDLSYLAVPEYVVNLMKQGDKGLHLIAQPEDILYGGFAFTEIPYDDSAVVPDLGDLLRELYSKREDRPRFSSTRFRLPDPKGGDSLIYRLTDFTDGRHTMGFSELIMLDILASNSGKDGKNLLFLSSVNTDFQKGLGKELGQGLYGVYYPGPDINVSGDLLGKELNAASQNKRGNVEGYIDPTTERQLQWRRADWIIGARNLLLRGDKESALRGIELIERRLSYDILEPGVVAIADSNFNEGVEYSLLLRALADSTGNTIFRERAVKHEARMEEIVKSMQEYYNSLSDRQRRLLSGRSRRILSTASTKE